MPLQLTCGCRRWLTSCSASRRSSPQSTVTLVVPSPTSSSCVTVNRALTSQQRRKHARTNTHTHTQMTRKNVYLVSAKQEWGARTCIYIYQVLDRKTKEKKRRMNDTRKEPSVFYVAVNSNASGACPYRFGRHPTTVA